MNALINAYCTVRLTKWTDCMLFLWLCWCWSWDWKLSRIRECSWCVWRRWVICSLIVFFFSYSRLCLISASPTIMIHVSSSFENWASIAIFKLCCYVCVRFVQWSSISIAVIAEYLCRGYFNAIDQHVFFVVSLLRSNNRYYLSIKIWLFMKNIWCYLRTKEQLNRFTKHIQNNKYQLEIITELWKPHKNHVCSTVFFSLFHDSWIPQNVFARIGACTRVILPITAYSWNDSATANKKSKCCVCFQSNSVFHWIHWSRSVNILCWTIHTPTVFVNRI